jgi:hypothetical protein
VNGLAAASRLAVASAGVRARFRAFVNDFQRRFGRASGASIALKGGGEVEALMMRVTRHIAIALIAAAVASPLTAQTTVVRPGQIETTTATISRIDLPTRFVSLRGDDGSELGVFVPADFTRLNELRVGDTVTITYYESVVFRLRRRGDPKPPVSEEVAASETTGSLPGATLSHQVTERVTVKAVDREAPSITVTDRHGRTVARHVERASNLDGVKPGDHIDITYTAAVLATVTRAK